MKKVYWVSRSEYDAECALYFQVVATTGHEPPDCLNYGPYATLREAKRECQGWYQAEMQGLRNLSRHVTWLRADTVPMIEEDPE